MYKLNSFFQPNFSSVTISSDDSLNPFFENGVSSLRSQVAGSFGFSNINTFSFTPEGIFGFMNTLEGKIGVSVYECEYIIQGAELLRKSGGDVTFVNRDFKSKDFDYLFISPIAVDTFEILDIDNLDCKVISNISFTRESASCNYALIDSQKLCGIGSFGGLLFNEGLSRDSDMQTDVIALKIFQEARPLKSLQNIKTQFLNRLKELLQEDLDFFVNPEYTHKNTLHLRLKGIKARELIRSLALEDVVISNGERCSLGLSQPSRVIQEMGFSEAESRESLSLSFEDEFNEEEITEISKKIAKKYRQIKALSWNIAT